MPSFVFSGASLPKGSGGAVSKIFKHASLKIIVFLWYFERRVMNKFRRGCSRGRAGAGLKTISAQASQKTLFLLSLLEIWSLRFPDETPIRRHPPPLAQLCSARLGSALLGSARLGPRLDSIRLGSARPGSAQLGLVPGATDRSILFSAPGGLIAK